MVKEVESYYDTDLIKHLSIYIQLSLLAWQVEIFAQEVLLFVKGMYKLKQDKG